MENEKPDIAHIERQPDSGWENVNEDAKQANFLEHSLGFFEGVKKYPLSITWSLLVSMTIVMEGYDTILIGNFFGYPSFIQKYGSYYPGIGMQLSGPWQVGLNNAAQIGPIIGAFANGYLSQKFGFRRVLLVALGGMTGTIFISFFSPTIEVLLVGLIFCGICWGIFATIGPAYSSEVCPLAFRGYLTAYTNMCFAMGQFIAGGVLEGLVNIPNEWSYRIPFAVQWAFPLPLFCILWFAPESPWWLVRKGKYDDAVKVMRRLTLQKTDEVAEKQMIAMMIHTNELEQEIESGSSWLDCFRGVDLRRTEIACLTFSGQVTCGANFAYGASYFFEQAGMSANDAYRVNLGGTAIAFVGTIIAWFLMHSFGRRRIYNTGMFIMSLLLFIIACLDFGRASHQSVKWVQASLAVLWLFVFSMTVGPIGWAIPAEISATRLRQKTICLARISYYLVTIFANSIEPYMINPTEWNWRGKTGYFWAGTAFLTFVWAFFRLPESKGRTFAELDVLFAKHINARKFAQISVDAYDEYGKVNE